MNAKKVLLKSINYVKKLAQIKNEQAILKIKTLRCFI